MAWQTNNSALDILVAVMIFSLVLVLLIVSTKIFWKNSSLRRICLAYNVHGKGVSLAALNRERLGNSAVSFGQETADGTMITIYLNESALFIDINRFVSTDIILHLPFEEITLEKTRIEEPIKFYLTKSPDIPIQIRGGSKLMRRIEEVLRNHQCQLNSHIPVTSGSIT